MTNEEILANAPKDGAATHILVDHEHHVTYAKRYPDSGNWFWFHPDSGWLEFDRMPTAQNIQSLSDIRRIVELEKEVKKWQKWHLETSQTLSEVCGKAEAAERERNEAHNELLAVFALSTVSQSNESFDYGRRLLNKFAIEQKIEELEQFLEHLKWNFTWSHAVYGFINERINQLRQQLNGDSQ